MARSEDEPMSETKAQEKTKIGSQRERPIKRFTKKGRPIFMSRKEEREWRNTTQTKIRD